MWFLLLLLAIGCDEAQSPTYYDDVQPIITRSCATCHSDDGVAIALTLPVATALSKTIYDKVTSGEMPPWMPDETSVKLADSFGLSAKDRETILAWTKNPIAGSYQPAPPRPARLPQRPADKTLMMDVDYVGPSLPSDEYRCFVIGQTSQSVSIAAYEWILPSGRVLHHITGQILNARGVASALARSGTDGRPGYNCISIDSADTVTFFGVGSSGNDIGTALPDGLTYTIPTGGAIALQVHYVVGATGGRAGVKLWTSTDTNDLPLTAWPFWAPVELPCPTGVVDDVQSPCNRQNAFNRETILSPSETQELADGVWSNCGGSAATFTAGLSYTSGVIPQHWIVPTSCEIQVSGSPTIWLIHLHAHTRATSIALDIAQPGEDWKTVLNIPWWRWHWERPYRLAEGLHLSTGSRARVRCTLDNGSSTQWSRSTHQPSVDDFPVVDPEDPQYQIMAYERGNEMCEAFLYGTGW